MTKNYLLTVAFILFHIPIFATSNLVISASNLLTPSVSKGQNVSVSVTIRNSGTSTSGQSRTGFYIKLVGSTEWILMGTSVIKRLGVSESVTIELVHPVNNFVKEGSYNVGARADIMDEVVESDESNMRQLSATLTINATKVGIKRVPYPYIFIHGLCGDANTWTDFASVAEYVYGWQHGGTMNFCLNYDGYDKKKSSISTDYKDFNTPLSMGDYYAVNFATDLNGLSYAASSQSTILVGSNQSAIVKQGRAIKDAIRHVMDVTGSEKVILIGHSMGGLAAREYIQNVSNWQSDGRHHVAKLFTIGTPHGGSNLTGAVLAGYFLKIDEQSEATRDLRYESVTYSGRYLFGGTESNFHNLIPSIFYNNDTNCNGQVGDAIVGLNSKICPSDIDYSCTIGVSSVRNDDGVVSADRANLANYVNNSRVAVDTFVDRVSPVSGYIQHNELHKRFENNMKGMDETYDFQKAYKIAFNTLNWGTITYQSYGAPYARDYDDYKVQMTQKGALRLRAYNIPVQDFSIDVVNSRYESVCNIIYAAGKGMIDTTINLGVGQYFIEISGDPNSGSVYFPYVFKVDYLNSTTPVSDVSDESDISIFPNPAKDVLTVSVQKSTPSVSGVKIIDMMGKEYQTVSINGPVTELDISTLPNGLYMTVFYGEHNELISTQKVIVGR